MNEHLEKVIEGIQNGRFSFQENYSDEDMSNLLTADELGKRFGIKTTTLNMLLGLYHADYITPTEKTTRYYRLQDVIHYLPADNVASYIRKLEEFSMFDDVKQKNLTINKQEV